MVVGTHLDRPVAGVHDLQRHGTATLVQLYVARGNLHFTWNHGAHTIGLWTVTSLVPSGNVASTWMSGIISGTPSMTSPRLRSVAPQPISSETDFPSRAPSMMAALI